YNFSLFLKERCPKGREVNCKTAKPLPNPLLKNERELVRRIRKRGCPKKSSQIFVELPIYREVV
ncbi:hypothetical protein ACR777_17550, partial [Sphingobacterium spiritivorum]|uniref:hypothetical protein n=1 Tax=Sphingobacterium spiritivorum TaxID=258 RepID=UPI003DA4E76B